MTAPARSEAIPLDPAGDPLQRCLASLLEAAEAADALGIPTDRARAAHDDASRRLGFPSEAYVLALVGGTGVGKSSLLNAIAGATVSPASVRRPTTSEPIAWIPSGEGERLRPLLEWLGVDVVREHDASTLGTVAILDLPDMDSVASAHRERVEAVLPRVDAVAWVTDLEKYGDAVLHDTFLRTWVPRLDRQAVIVNKADRLSEADGPRVRRDLEADLRQRLALREEAAVPVLMTSAVGERDIGELQSWLGDGAVAKAVVRARVAASAIDLARDLATDAGIDLDRAATPFLPPRDRAAAIDAATREALRAVDLPGLERQAVAATRARARARGTGPIGQLTSLIYRLSGRETAVADPEGYLLRWRDRAGLAPAAEALRQALGPALASASPMVRPRLAVAVEAGELRQGVERAVDRSIGSLEPLEAPSSRWWSLVGLLQTLATAGIALAAAWILVWILAKPPVDSVTVPVLGQVPIPFATLVVFLIIGYLFARLLSLHAGWIGRRWAGRVRERVAESVRREVTERGLAALDLLEDARRRLWETTASIVRDCRRP
jgi:hypothetical protein